MSHYLYPQTNNANVLVLYRDFKDYDTDYGEKGYGKCHRGLGVNSVMTVKVLRKHGIRANMAPVWDLASVRKALQQHCPTHAIIEALWIPLADQLTLCHEFPETHFVARCHSQIGFLQVEPGAIKTLRDLMAAQEQVLNLSVSANTERLTQFLQKVYRSRVVYLPNLYVSDRVSHKKDRSHSHRLVKIGSFGAHRVLKNHTTAAAAAMLIAEQRGSELEFYVNGGREEGQKASHVSTSLKAMFANVPWAKLVQVPWQEWSQFRHTVAAMDLCLQASFTETFNICVADSVSEGVPCVVGTAIEWAPERWKANTDDALDLARVGSHLLWDPNAGEEGQEALKHHQKKAVHTWFEYLASNPT